MKIILASQSPFRQHALDVLGLKYEIIPSDLDESKIHHHNPRKLVCKLSRAKARRIGVKNPDSVVIAADLLVVHNGKILEKPKDLDDAQSMLQSLSGHRFEIISGLAVYNSQNLKMLSSVSVCDVAFRNLSGSEITDYINRYPALKCAGAFEADGLLRFAKSINGSYNFKAGLAVEKLVKFLKINGVYDQSNQDKLILPSRPTLRDYQDYTAKMVVQRGFEDETILQVCLLLGEEVGELFKAIRKDGGIKVDNNSHFGLIEDELSDILIYTCQIANRYGIDLEAAFRAKEEKNEKRSWQRDRKTT